MLLKEYMTHDGVIEYLTDDLQESIRRDVHPAIQIGNAEGGYFAVPRLVLCYVDFLGALYRGYRGHGNIATSVKAQAFIRDFMGHVDPLYRKNADLFYDMYRHGTVHLYQPKTFSHRVSRRFLYWLAYKGKREDWLNFQARAIRVRHMEVFDWNDSVDYLPISIVCLYEDLHSTIDYYKLRIQKEKEDGRTDLLNNWNCTAAALLRPEEKSW